MTTTTKLTRRQIETLRTEAGTAGDARMVGTCDRAIDGCPIALQAVADAIAAAAAQADGDEYRVAFASANGDWDVVETFHAANDDAANAYAYEHYADKDWYVLDNTGHNINGGVDG